MTEKLRSEALTLPPRNMPNSHALLESLTALRRLLLRGGGLAGFGTEGAPSCRPFQTVAIPPGGGRYWLFPSPCLPDGFLDASFNPLLDPPPCGLLDMTICRGR
jgi:hypothetical protein